MHYLMLVTARLPNGSTSEDARCKVRDALLRDDSFCGSGGRFGYSLCDWFVIGGRWSGKLAYMHIGQRLQSALHTRFPQLREKDSPESIAKQHRAEFDAIWESCGGTAPNPYARTGYEELGHLDDAQLLTRELYDALLSKFEGESSVQNESHCEFVDLEGESLSTDFIGRKWLIVVDYHS